MRRVIVHEYKGEHGFYGKNFYARDLFNRTVELYRGFYPELEVAPIIPEFEKEKDRFIKTLEIGLKELEKLKEIDARSAFKLYESFGLSKLLKIRNSAGKARKI